ncbi:hypothetical protein N7462_007564 [Penicillium macrosclerotiorum]|uniref:uncharacterized protein n=1 Tax=Penicillium macrosclerotiorum TaxID=303699 RepID=UPI002548769B|nr:uncharacterized protein N7462_007564 [Penicillium macrosclerotiorum]KAJ5679320.1 hypothetical protein N7462_007564 [Penicillium macrosclerotiorum]
MEEPTNATTPTTNETENSKAEEEVKYALPGSICDVRNLYQTKPDENGETSWTKDLPESLIAPVEDAESAQYALIVRHTKCYDGRKSLSIHSVVVQSESLKNFLGKVLAGYPGVTTTLERLEFHSPFRPLVHRWEDLINAREEQELDPVTKEHVDLFYKILEEELRDVIARKKDLVRNGVITHNLLWTLFEPDELVISGVGGSMRGFLFVCDIIDCQTKAWIPTCKYIDWAGENFGYRDEYFRVNPFTGTTPITALPVFPLKYHADKEVIRDQLMARGKVWEGYKGYHYKQYEGTAIGFLDDEETRRYHVKSRVIIDTEAFNIFHPHVSVYVYGYSEMPEELNDDERVVTSNRLHGYSLKDKEWLQFYLESCTDIVWDSRAFESLVLPQEQQGLKDLILAFANTQSKHLDSFDDVVQGKGRGIIMQLSGPPGVGKTLTAESVAEVMQVPLYAMSAGDLGSTASSVEDSLKDILRMIPKWGAVLLLDEADVFMEARSATDLQRNELVSIFLRMLEYYEGILFLTTNRAEHIDPAFESRIHVSLAYKDLDASSRRHIWTQFLGRSANTAPFTDEQLDKLARVPLNGRQIKNMIKTASLLAWSQTTDLNFEHVQVVLNLRTSNALKMT